MASREDAAEGGRELGRHVVYVLSLLELTGVHVQRHTRPRVPELARDTDDVEAAQDEVRPVRVP